MQKTLAEIVDKFNNGIGKEMGITVESFAQGEMPDLENAVTAAIKAGNTPNVSLTEAAAAARSSAVITFTFIPVPLPPGPHSPPPGRSGPPARRCGRFPRPP